LHFVDGSVIRAHQHAAGAADSNAKSEALGYSKGGFSTKSTCAMTVTASL
jgi:hypothetical protein